MDPAGPGPKDPQPHHAGGADRIDQAQSAQSSRRRRPGQWLQRRGDPRDHPAHCRLCRCAVWRRSLQCRGRNCRTSHRKQAMNVAFIGVGAMGAPMAACIARAHHELTLYDTVRDLYLREGLAQKLRRGTIAIDMSSSDPMGTRELGAALAASGITLIDAPVSGGVPRAVLGTLTIMMGGDDPAAIDRARPVLRAMGDRLFDTGGLGSGHAMKALNNFVAGASFAACAEAL